jgi:Cu-processing system permease protein
MRPGIVLLLAGREVRTAVRTRWFLVGAIAFALLAVAVASLGMAGARQWGISALDRTSAALLNLVLLFVPLLTLPLGASSFSGEAEDGTLPYLVAQPVTRGEVFLGKLFGLQCATTLSLLLGFGAAAVWIGAHGAAESRAFLALVVGAALLGIVTTTLGVLLSIAARTRARSLAAAIGAWLLLVFLCDFGVLALAAAQTLGPNALFSIALANPLQAAKTLCALAISERLEILGPAGIHAVHLFGRPLLAALLAGGLALWTALGGASAFLLFRRQNLA